MEPIEVARAPLDETMKNIDEILDEVYKELESQEEVARLREKLAEFIGRPEHLPTGEPPAEIWLQWYGDGDENYPDTEYGYGITWSSDKIFERDVRYTRSPEAPADPD